MKDLNTLAQNFLAKKETKTSLPSKQPFNSFKSLFDVQNISEQEKHILKEIMPDIQDNDFQTISQITAEVRSIHKQGVLLIGERLFKAKQVFKKYSHGEMNFSKWLRFAFSSLKTAYNALGFYDLYNHLPSEHLKKKLKEMPAKSSYILASRKGELEDKIAIISSYEGQTHDEVFSLIEQKFPTDLEDKRGQKKPKLILKRIEKECNSLAQLRGKMNQEQKGQIQQMIEKLQSLLEV